MHILNCTSTLTAVHLPRSSLTAIHLPQSTLEAVHIFQRTLALVENLQQYTHLRVHYSSSTLTSEYNTSVVQLPQSMPKVVIEALTKLEHL